MTADWSWLLVNILPVVIFVGIFAFISIRTRRHYRSYESSIADFKATYVELIAINKEMAGTLVEIRALLEAKKP